MSNPAFLQLVSLPIFFIAATAVACPMLQVLHASIQKQDVTVRLSCTSHDGKAAPTPTAAEFSALIKNAPPVPALQVHPSMEPIDLVVVVQTSAIVQDAKPEIQRGLRRIAPLIKAVPDSTITLITYGSEAQTALSRGRIAAFEQSIDNLTIDQDATEPHLLLAIREARERLTGGSAERRKVVLLLSDGADADMRPRLVERAFRNEGQRFRAAGIVVMALGYAQIEPERLRYMLGLARSTGGSGHIVSQPGDIDKNVAVLVDALARQLLVTFPLPPGLQGDNASMQVLYADETTTSVSTAFAAQAPRGMEVESALPWWLIWLSLAGLVSSLGLLIHAARWWARMTAVRSQRARQTALAPARVKTTKMSNGKSFHIGWVVQLDPLGAHKSMPVDGVLVLGAAPHRCQITKLKDGFELVELDRDGERRWVEDGQWLQLGAAQYKFKSLRREEG